VLKHPRWIGCADFMYVVVRWS